MLLNYFSSIFSGFFFLNCTEILFSQNCKRMGKMIKKKKKKQHEKFSKEWKFRSGGKLIKALKLILPTHAKTYAQVDRHTHIYSDDGNRKQSL